MYFDAMLIVVLAQYVTMFSGSLKLSVLTCFMALSLVEGKITDKCMDCLAKVRVKNN